MKIEFTRIKNDINGNPRYVCHFTELLKESEKDFSGGWRKIQELYSLASKRANGIGGKKYNTKKFGGGIVFQSYNINDTENRILNLIK